MIRTLFLALLLLSDVARAALQSETFEDASISRDSLTPSGTFGEEMVGYLYGDDNRVVIVPFKLPYVAPGQQITGASVTLNYIGKNGEPRTSIDVYGLARSAITGSPKLSDFFIGAEDRDSTLLAKSFVTSSTQPGLLTLTGPDLLKWLQGQYSAMDTDSMNDRYVFLRLNGDGMENQQVGNTNYNFSSADHFRPQIATLTLTVSGTPTALADRLQFSFNAAANEITSAGVYLKGRLVRTLWNNVPATAGTNVGAWDGKDDAGVPAEAGAYEIRVLANNVSYVWEGVIGNSSSSNVGPHVWRSFEPPRHMDIAGDTACYAVGYNEGQCLFNEFSVSNPQAPTQLYNNDYGTNDPFSDFSLVAYDGKMSYWAKTKGGMDPAFTYVIALGPDNKPYDFPKGDKIPPTPGRQKYTSGLDLDVSAGQPNGATGLAVQKSGPYLFVAHANANEIDVFDKVSGEMHNEMKVPSPGLCATDPAGNLYVLSGAKILKFAGDGKGGEQAPLLTISGLTAPVGLACDPSTNTVAVADNGSVKAFDSASGAAKWTYGTLQTVPAIRNDTFLLGPQVPLGFQSDGSFWVGDFGNFRLCHYRVAGTAVSFIEQVIYQPASYTASVDANDPSHCTTTFFEFTQDFTKPLEGLNGSWTLVNNWAVGLPPRDATHLYQNDFITGIENMVTLSNGRRYALIRNHALKRFELFELPASGPARFTGEFFSRGRPRIYPDGSLRYLKSTKDSETFYIQKLSGFDASNNPHWDEAKILAHTAKQADDPEAEDGIFGIRIGTTSTNMLPVLGPGWQDKPHYHFGVIPVGGDGWVVRTMRDMPGNKSYTGKLPRDGRFDSGNHVQYAANVVTVSGRNCFIGYNGEFWKNGETGTDYHFLDDGLMVGSFGTLGAFVTRSIATAGFAGNNFAQELATDPAGQLHLWTNDESNHGGISRWRINNLQSISEHSATGKLGQVIEIK